MWFSVSHFLFGLSIVFMLSENTIITVVGVVLLMISSITGE